MRHSFFDLPGPIILGHRGAAGVAPENTLVSFARALEQGAHVIESDVHATRDGVPVLLHDPAVERTTDGRGAISQLTLDEVRALDAGHCFSADGGPKFPFRKKGLGIPTLKEAFQSFEALRFNLEIKAESPELVRSIVELVRETKREHCTLLTAGEDAIMSLLRAELARSGVAAAVGASMADILAVVKAAIAGEPPATDAMALQIPSEFGGRPLVTRKLVDHCHAHGIHVHVWTINEPAHMSALLDLGVDGIVTDYPALAAELLATRGA